MRSLINHITKFQLFKSFKIGETTINVGNDKEIMSNQNVNQIKSVKTPKTPKKLQDCKKSANDVKIEDVFLNSEYFKYQSGNLSPLSFCSGDNGENQWSVDSKFEIPFHQKASKFVSHSNDLFKSDTSVLVQKEAKPWVSSKMKNFTCTSKENSQEKTERFLEGILSGKGRTDRDLITLITEQMFLAERELQITRTHLIDTIGKLNERDLEIIKLHEKIRCLQKTAQTALKEDKEDEQCISKTSEDYQRLVLASEKLKKQVKDMEDFLNDYGLVWIGDKETSEKPDFDKIIKSFQRLNSLASRPKIIQTTLGAKFELPREIPVVLYSNGLLLRENDFREYNKVSTNLFLQDIEDGYFPSELQIEFPEGVPFEVFDKRNETYNQTTKIPAFRGCGHRLGSTLEGKLHPPISLNTKLVKERESDPLFNHDCFDKSLVKKVHKKGCRNLVPKDDSQNYPIMSATNLQLGMENEQNSNEKKLRFKIRFGRNQTESFALDMPEGKCMSVFKKLLQKKLCQKYNDKGFVDYNSNNLTVDFELHVYGRHPIRLSDHLHQYPRELGLSDNSVINVTEI